MRAILRRRIGRGELDLVALIVAEPEHRRLDDEAVAALDEPAPVGAAAEFAVGHHLETGVLLQPHHVADALRPGCGESASSISPRHGLGTPGAAPAGRSRLPTWSARNGGRPVSHGRSPPVALAMDIL